VAEHRCHTCCHGIAGVLVRPARQEHGQGAFDRVQKHRRHGGAHAARPQDVGGAHVAAADTPQIDATTSCHQVRERHRAAQVTERDDENVDGSRHCHDSSSPRNGHLAIS
jgi:hypothetical protein